jgi:von Willebrand factor type D domain
MISNAMKHMMRLFIAVIVSVVIIWPSNATTVKINRFTDRFQDITGNCRTFAQSIIQGVTDASGIMHESAAAWTQIDPTFDGLADADWFQAWQEEKLDRPYKNVEFFESTEIKDSGRFCARASNFQVDLGAQVEVTKLKWQHGEKPNSKCAKESQRLKKLIDSHEEKHVRDVKPWLDDAANRLRRVNVTNCAASQQAAADGLPIAVVNVLQDWMRGSLQDWEKRRKALDDGPNADRATIDCSNCKSDPPQDPLKRKTPMSEGRSYGDPHLISFDGFRYSFQTVGEFILTQSEDGKFIVQTRQAPVPARDLSLNTAVAVQAGKDRVSFYVQNFPDADKTPVWLNGQPFKLKQGTFELPQGGVIQHTGQDYVVQSPTGETVTIRSTQWADRNFMNVTVAVPSDRTYRGVLGNHDGNPANDLTTRNGQSIPTESSYGQIRQALSNVLPTIIPLSGEATPRFW